MLEHKVIMNKEVCWIYMARLLEVYRSNQSPCNSDINNYKEKKSKSSNSCGFFGISFYKQI